MQTEIIVKLEILELNVAISRKIQDSAKRTGNGNCQEKTVPVRVRLGEKPFRKLHGS